MRSCSPTTGGPPGASSLTASSGAAPGSKPWTCASPPPCARCSKRASIGCYLLAAQASRPLSFSDPAYTEQTNLVGPRLVAEAIGDGGAPAELVYGSSLHVYGPELSGEVTADQAYGPQGDLAHLSKVYAELCLDLYARRHGFHARAAPAGNRLRP